MLENNEALNIYVNLLLKWNASINLIGKSTESEIWERHIKDSSFLKQYIPDDARSVIDFGTGAGFPGMVLAILCPQLNVHLFEKNTKKTTFLKQVVQEISRPSANNLQERVIIHNKAIEEIPPFHSDIIVSRAFAPLTKLLNYIYPFINQHSLCLLPKGKNADKELAEARVQWQFACTELPAYDTDSVVLKIQNLRGREEA